MAAKPRNSPRVSHGAFRAQREPAGGDWAGAGPAFLSRPFWASGPPPATAQNRKKA